MRISIIGSGWLAQPLAKQLMLDGHDVIMTSQDTEKANELTAKDLSTVPYQLGEHRNINDRLFNTEVLIIAITCKDADAFSALFSQLDPAKTVAVIFISSTSVYQNNKMTHNEDSLQLSAASPLLEIEKIINTHPKATILRYAGLAGPGRHPGKFFSNGKKIKNPNAPVNMIHLDDCIGIINAVINQDAWGEVFNGCADTHPSKLTYYTHMATTLGVDAPEFEETSSGSNKTIDNQKSKSELSYLYLFPDVMTFSFGHKKAH